MADQRLTTRTSASDIDDLDLIHIVDVSDPTSHPSGTSKRGLFSLFKSTLKTFFDSIYQIAGNYVTTDTIQQIDADKAYNRSSVQIDALGDLSVVNKRYVIEKTVAAGGLSPLTTKGDVFIFGTTNQRLPIGSDDQVLTADSSDPAGVKWSEVSGGIGGSITDTQIAVGLPTADEIGGSTELTYDGTTLRASSRLRVETADATRFVEVRPGNRIDTEFNVGGLITIISTRGNGFRIGSSGADPTSGSMLTIGGDFDVTGNIIGDGSLITNIPQVLGFAFSDETTDLAVGTSAVSFQMPNFATTLSAVSVNVVTAPTGSVATFDINEAGVSILSTKITIDAGEFTSEDAATPPVISDSAIAANAIITVDIDGVGSTITGAGGKVWIYFTRT